VRLVTFTESDQKPDPGALQGDRVVDLSDQIGSIQELIDGGGQSSCCQSMTLWTKRIDRSHLHK